MMTTELPAGLTSLGKGAFAGCSSLTSIALPALGSDEPLCLEPAVIVLDVIVKMQASS